MVPSELVIVLLAMPESSCTFPFARVTIGGRGKSWAVAGRDVWLDCLVWSSPPADSLLECWRVDGGAARGRGDRALAMGGWAMDGCTVVVAVLRVGVVRVRGGRGWEVVVAVEGACAVVGVVHMGLLGLTVMMVVVVVSVSRCMDAAVAVGAEALFWEGGASLVDGEARGRTGAVVQVAWGWVSGTHYVYVCQRKRRVSVARRVEMGLRIIKEKKCVQEVEGRGYEEKKDKSREEWRERRRREERSSSLVVER
jgi:hypothetical protein